MLTIRFLHRILAFAATMPPGVGIDGPFKDQVYSWSTQRALAGATRLQCLPSLLPSTSTTCAALQLVTSTALSLISGNISDLDLPLGSAVTIALPLDSDLPPWKPETLVDQSAATSLYHDLYILQCSDDAFEPEPVVLPSCSAIPKGLGFYLLCEDIVEPEVKAHSTLELVLTGLDNGVDSVSAFLVSQWSSLYAAASSLSQLVYTLVLSALPASNSVATTGFSKAILSILWSPTFFVVFPAMASLVWTFWFESSSTIIELQAAIGILALSVEHLLRKCMDRVSGLAAAAAAKCSRFLREFSALRCIDCSMVDGTLVCLHTLPEPAQELLCRLGHITLSIRNSVGTRIVSGKRSWSMPTKAGVERMLVNASTSVLKIVWFGMRLVEIVCDATSVDTDAVALSPQAQWTKPQSGSSAVQPQEQEQFDFFNSNW